MLFRSGAEISASESTVYIKAIEKKDQLSFDEFEILLNLKVKLFDANRNGFLNSVGLKEYWSGIESKSIGSLFNNSSTYNFLLFRQYVSICVKLSKRLSLKQATKLFLKAVINYKVK